MEHVGRQFETLKSRVFSGDKDSAEPRPVKFSLTPKTSKTIEEWDKEMSLSNRKITTRMNYFKCLRRFFFYLCKEKGMETIGLENLKKEDLLDFFHNINSGAMATGTVNIHKWVVKTLFKYMSGEDDFPKIVKWIKQERQPRPKLPKNLITEEQIKKLITYARNSRDKAIISCLAECGGRVSELLNTNIDDLEFLFDEETRTPIVRIRLVDIKGHTGERRVELFDSVPYLQSWLNDHPGKDDQESPLFIAIGNRNFGERMGRNMVWSILKNAGIKAGLENCTLNPHSFRHRALTEKGKFMSKFELSRFAGHTMSSRMTDVYVNLEDNDVCNKLRQARGLAPIEGVRKVTRLKVKRCDCGEVNPHTALFCNRCREPLDEKFVRTGRENLKRTIEKESFAKDFMNFATQDSEFVKVMEKVMQRFVRENA